MRTLKAIGPGTATVLLAYMPELGTFSRAGAASMAGVAPFDDESGKKSLPAISKPPGRRPQGALHGGPDAAIRYNPIMKSFAEKLRQKGKPAKG